MHVPGNAFTGERTGVQGGIAFLHNAVQGDSFAGTHHNDTSHGYLFRIHFLLPVFRFHTGEVRPDIHQLADVFPAFTHRIALEQLADLVEKHHGNGFVKVAGFQQADDQGTDGGHSHQEVLVEHLAVQDALECLPEDVVTDNPVRNQVQKHPGKPLQDAVLRDALQVREIFRQEMKNNQQRAGYKNPDQHFFLLLRHGSDPRLQVNLAVILDLFAGFDNLLHDFGGLRVILKGNDHFLGHEIHGDGFHAGNLCGGTFHLVGTVGAVHFDLIGLFHDSEPLSSVPFI